MKVFIFEYVCGGGLAGRPLPESLAGEGWAMLASIVEGFARVEGCEVVTTLDERFAGRSLAARRVERIDGDTERRVIERLASECDWSLVIAPEFDGILLDRVRWVKAAGGRLLGPLPIAVEIASDKLECGQLLQRSDVPAVVGQVVNLADGFPKDVEFPVVLKPRFGAGSQCTFLIRDADAIPQILQSAMVESMGRELLLQPFVAGMAASMSFLVGPAVAAVPLLAGEQRMSVDGRFRYCGGRIPLDAELSDRAEAIASRAVAALPGLQGLVGVDLVLGPDVVIEINPRPTTSYVGLRQLAVDNLAEVWLKLLQGAEPQPIRWRPGTICFRADGTIA